MAELRRIHVDTTAIDKNTNQKTQLSPIQITNLTGEMIETCDEVTICGIVRVIYEPHTPTRLGARLWIECEADDIIETQRIPRDSPRWQKHDR